MTARLLVLAFLVAAGFVLALTASPAYAHHTVDAAYRFASPPPYTVAATDLVNARFAIQAWNSMAGTEALVMSDDPEPDIAWVEVVDGRSRALYPYGDRRQCIIHIRHGGMAAAQHELGHCLGFGDHIRVDSPRASTNVSTGVFCDGEEASAYRGIMSYCDWSQPAMWWGEDDREMVRRMLREWVPDRRFRWAGLGRTATTVGLR